MSHLSPRFSIYIVTFLFVALGVYSCTGSSTKTTKPDLDSSPQDNTLATHSSSPESDSSTQAAPAIDLTPALQLSADLTNKALIHAADSSLGMRDFPDEPLDYREILDPDRTIPGSLSQGTIRDGSLINAATLPTEGDYHEIIDRHRRRNTQFATSEMVDALMRAARTVNQEHGGAPLRLGNISYHQGGRIPWSNSHRAGRDADIAFYTLDEDGDSVPAPDLIEFDGQGRALGHDLYFDIPRNWTLVRALLTDPDIKIQWIFVSLELKALLLLHALEINEDPDIFERAASVLHQPSDAPPHADHFHLRIACAETDRLEGCIDWGPRWKWHEWHQAALFARTREVQRAFDDPSPNMRRRALEYLYEIHSPFGAEIALILGIRDEHSDVREQAFALLSELRVNSDAGIDALGKAFEVDDLTDNEREILYETLRHARPNAAADLAIKRYQSTALEEHERALALKALAHRMEPRTIPFLLDALANEASPFLRGLLADQLRRVTARTDNLDWTADPLDERHEQALKEWHQWWENIEPDRTVMLQHFLTQFGIYDWPDMEAVDKLIPLLRRQDDYLRYNLNRVLARWTGRWVTREWENDDAAYHSWSRWWNRNRDRLLDDTPQPWE